MGALSWLGLITDAQLSAPLPSLLEIKLIGTAQSFQQLMGGSWWLVRVDRVISGPQPCSEELKVITWTSAAPPVLWGNADPEITPNDRVQVYGRYTEEAGECSVTLMGSEQYFIRLPIELRSAQIEIRPSSTHQLDSYTLKGYTIHITHERRSKMRTNIVIDDKLMQGAMRATGLPTKRAVVEAGLRLLIQVKAQGGIRRLRGKVSWEGNLDVLRSGRSTG